MPYAANLIHAILRSRIESEPKEIDAVCGFANCCQRDARRFHFEFFPPKTDEGLESLRESVRALRDLDPTFVSVTYGAGGSTRDRTIELVSEIQRHYGLTAMAHLTCVGAGREEIAQVLDRLRLGDVTNVLALRGDPPKGEEAFTVPKDGFAYASELTAFIKERGEFCVGGACYPRRTRRMRRFYRRARSGSRPRKPCA